VIFTKADGTWRPEVCSVGIVGIVGIVGVVSVISVVSVNA
jgi:hypothetical protein